MALPCTRVFLPCTEDPILLSVEDKVKIPSELWGYAAETINNAERTNNWLFRDLPDHGITGVIRWLGILPPVGGTQLFAGIQTVSIFIFVYFSIAFNFAKIDLCKSRLLFYLQSLI